jgi:hypothetical protein
MGLAFPLEEQTKSGLAFPIESKSGLAFPIEEPVPTPKLGHKPSPTAVQAGAVFPARPGRGFTPVEIPEEDTFAEIAVKAAGRGGMAPVEAFVGAEEIKLESIKQAKEALRPLLPRPAGKDKEERRRAIAEMTGKPYEPPVERPEVKEELAPMTKMAKQAIEKGKEIYKVEAGDSRVKQNFASGIESLVNMVVTLPLGGLKAMSLVSGLKKGAEVLEEGAPLWKVYLSTAIQTATEFYTEKGPIDELLKPATKFLTRLRKGAIKDVKGELIATSTEMAVIDEAIGGKNYTAEQYQRALEDTAMVAFGMTAAGTAAVHPAIVQQERLTRVNSLINSLRAETAERSAEREIPIDEEQIATLPLARPVDEVSQDIESVKGEALSKALKGQSTEVEAETIKSLEQELDVSKKRAAEPPPTEQVLAEHEAELQEKKDRLEVVEKRISKLEDTPEGFKEGTHLKREKRFLRKDIQDKTKIIKPLEVEVLGEEVKAPAPTTRIAEINKEIGEIDSFQASFHPRAPVTEGLVDSIKKRDLLTRELAELEAEKAVKEFKAGLEGQPAVVSGTLPVDRSGERGAITLPGKVEGTKEAGPIKRAYNKFKEFWNPLSTIPKSDKFLSARYKTLGGVARVEDFAGKLWDKTNKLEPQVKQDIFRFLDGEISKEALPEENRQLAQSLQNVLNTVGRMLVKRGMLDASTYEANKGQYVRYLYLKNILGDKFGRFTDGSGRLDLSYLKSRKDLTREEQRAIGLIEDVSVAVPIGVSQTLSDVVKYDFYDEISSEPEWTFTPSIVNVDGRRMGIGALVEEVKIAEQMNKQAPKVKEIKERLDTLKAALDKAKAESKNVPKDFVQLPTSKKMGPLSGAFIRKEIARDIMPIMSPTRHNALSKMVDVIIDVEKKGMAAFKVGKTALNPPTAFRNTVSNVMQLNLSGISLQDMPKHMIRAAVSMKNKDAHFVQARRNGLFKTNWAIAEIGEVLDTVKTMQKKNDVFGGIMKLAKYYGKIDDYFKLTKYIEQRNAGSTIETSVLEAQKWGMDYSRAHPFIKVARQHAAPFVSYQYKIAPLIAESLKKRPWVLAKYMALPLLINEIAKRRLNLSEEEKDRLERELPLFMKDRGSYIALPWRSKEGRAQWVNLEYYLPWSGMIELGRDIKEQRYNELPGDIGLGNPILDIYAVLKTTKGADPPKDPFTGREIYNQLDSPTDKALKLSEWLYNKWAPSMFTRYGTLGKASRVGELDRQGKETTVGQVISSMFGANIVSPTQKQVRIEKRVLIKELKSSLFRIVRDPTVSKEEKKRAREEFRRRRKEIMGHTKTQKEDAR